MIVYASLRQWPKQKFKAVLQAFFFLSALLVVLAHGIAGHFTPNLWVLYAYTVPALLLGILVSTRVDAGVRQEKFRTIVTVMILVLGVSLVLV